ncbi:MAG: TrkH family potassium uptake protein [Christensenellales bacterium]|jgi:trk system potassium uptake protein TrkH
MNYPLTRYILGQIALIEAAFLLIPLFIGAGYGEDTLSAFSLTIAVLLVLGIILTIRKPADSAVTAKGGFGIVALAWIMISLFGSLPFFISGYIPNFIDSVFETVSGFSTTGASILTNVEALPKSLLFWRSLTHWMGGMGVFVFIIAIMPKVEASIMQLFKAESPGPQAGKLVSKLKFTARILYGIYIALTLLEVVLLLLGKMPLFDSFIHAFGTAGTGGFSSKNLSVGHYNSAYIDTVISIFMIIFSINFNIYFLFLIGSFKQALKSEELRVFLSVITVSVVIISVVLSINSIYTNIGVSFRHSLFQVASLISTTGYTTADFASWPLAAQMILLLLMFVGACAGSTGGGLKISRIIILFKSGFKEIKRALSPRTVYILKFEGKPLDAAIHHGVLRYFSLYMIIFFISLLLVSTSMDNSPSSFVTAFTAIAACLNNIGPGLANIGPLGNYSGFSNFAKIILSLNMLIGRLEILPVLLLFSPKLWLKR